MNDELKRPEVPLFSINTAKCVDCAVPVCQRVCPVSAVIKKADHLYQIDDKRCIGCGDCLVYCPNGGVSFRNSIDEVKSLISNYKTVALLDPSISGEFEDITDYRKFVAMIKSLGFSNVHEVSFGVDMIAEKYNDLINNYRGKYYIFSTCPAIVNYVRKYHPDLIDNLAPFMSPSVALAKYLRGRYDENTKFVFIGPCIASKDEEFYSEQRYIDANITFRELRQMFKDSDIKELKAEFDNFDLPHGNKGAMYPLIDGLLYAADCEHGPVFSMAERRHSLDAVKTFENDIIKLQRHFNLFYCRCCSLGPGTTGGNFIMSDNAVKNYEKKRREALDVDLWYKWLDDASKTDIHTSFVVDDQRTPEPSEKQIFDVMQQIGYHTNGCRLCGFDNCRAFAKNVAQGNIDISSCCFAETQRRNSFTKELESCNVELQQKNKQLVENEAKLKDSVQKLKLESYQTKVLLNNLNAAVIIFDSELSIVKANKVFIKMLGEEVAEMAEIIPELVGADLRSLMPPEVAGIFMNVLRANQTINNKDVFINDRFYNLSIFPIAESRMAGAIIRDMHSKEIHKEQVINKINDVILENLTMVQKIGFLLGEGAAQTEQMLNSVIKSYEVTDNSDEEK